MARMLALALMLLAWSVTGAAAQVYPSDKTGALRFGGMAAEAQSAERPWSIHVDGRAARLEGHNLHVEGTSIRFEARQGDRRQKASEKDRPIERSEISFNRDNFEFGRTYTIHFELQFEPGAANTARALKFFQVHNVNDPGDADGLAPVLALQLDRERMRIVTRADASGVTAARTPDEWRFTDTADIERGRWYAFDIVVRYDPSGAGRLQVTRDGVRIVDVTGPIGYNDKVGPYAKIGIYRDTVPETAVIQFRNLSISAAD